MLRLWVNCVQWFYRLVIDKPKKRPGWVTLVRPAMETKEGLRGRSGKPEEVLFEAKWPLILYPQMPFVFSGESSGKEAFSTLALIFVELKTKILRCVKQVGSKLKKKCFKIARSNLKTLNNK